MTLPPPIATNIIYPISPSILNEALNDLFTTAWKHHTSKDFTPVLSRSLAYICAFVDDVLVGYVNLAWDGGTHAFILDTTVHAGFQRLGIGRQLVGRATAVAKARGIEWVHVDYEPHLEIFYQQCKERALPGKGARHFPFRSIDLVIQRHNRIISQHLGKTILGEETKFGQAFRIWLQLESI